MVNVNYRRTPAVYALHAGDERFFYVGSISKNSDNRLYEHIYRAHTGHKAPVYRAMRDLGIRNIQVVDLCPIADPSRRLELETAWIVRLLEEGHPLVNQLGRDGIPNSMSAEMKTKVSKSKKGKPTWIKGRTGVEAGWTEERRQAAAASMKARAQRAA